MSAGTGFRHDAAVLSPLVRRLVRDNDVDLARVSGSGAGGRVTGGDVRRWLAGRVTRPVRTTGPALSVVEVDFHNVDRVREPRRAAWQRDEGFPLTYLPFVCRAVIDALREFPLLNASVADGPPVADRSVGLGIAVDVDHAERLVPVIREAGDKRLPALARAVATLTERARRRALAAGESSGGTFTISDNGAAGLVLSAPVPVAQQVAILAAEAVARRVVVVRTDGHESMAIHTLGNLSMSWDDRAVGGLYAAEFLMKVKSILETRDWRSEL